MLDELGWEGDRRRAVGALIEATAGHEATDEPDRAVLLDADLAVLGSEPSAYQAYVTGVRVEYAHVDSEAWSVGRAAVLAVVPRPGPPLQHAGGQEQVGRQGAGEHGRRAGVAGVALSQRSRRGRRTRTGIGTSPRRAARHGEGRERGTDGG